MASPKPDLVMGTEGSPRGLVYYDPPSRNSKLMSPSFVYNMSLTKKYDFTVDIIVFAGFLTPT